MIVHYGKGAVVRVVRVERPDLVRSMQEVHPNSLSQYLLCFMREAVQLVSSPHFLQAGGGGTCGGHTSLGWKYMVFLGRAVGAGGTGAGGAGAEGAGAWMVAAGEGAVGAGAGSSRLCALPM